VDLEVFDTVSSPCPLVIRRQDISIFSEPGVLRVTEVLQIENPEKRTYVGVSRESEGEPVTLELSIPPEFQRITFQQEFYGRRFSPCGGKLVTSIPWTHGVRELAFTYVIPVNQESCDWQRSLDLPCRELHLAVHTTDYEGVSCNLPPLPSAGPHEFAFQSPPGGMPQGSLLRVELGHLRTPWISRARWIAVFTLIMLITSGLAILIFRRKKLHK
jgi:hypothetical protein